MTYEIIVHFFAFIGVVVMILFVMDWIKIEGMWEEHIKDDN